MTVPSFPDRGSPDPTAARPPAPGRRRPASGLDPLPDSRPRPPVGDVPLPDEVPDPARPGRPDAPAGRVALVATGREDGQRHVVDVAVGELGDPEGLRARCGAPVLGVVSGPPAAVADCPLCLAPH